MRLSPLLLFLAAPPSAQEAPRGMVPMRPGFEYLRPFRTPDKNLQPPLELYDELRKMQAIARDPGTKVQLDPDGREVCDSSAWRDARASAQIKATRMGGYLAVVCQESGDATDRALAYYGSYWLDSIQDTISIMALIPGEPVAPVRTEAMQRAIAFLRVQLARNRGGDSGPRAASPVDFSEGRAIGNRVYDDPNAPLYDFDLNPWCALVESPEPRARAQALWFLRELVLVRAQLGAQSLRLLRELMPGLVVDADAEVRKQARAFLTAVDPRQRPAPGDDATDADAAQWLAAILYDVFPPIRQISAGLVELHPSADLDRIAATGKDLLERDAIGSTASGTANGVFYRGFKVQRLPKPLDMLCLPKDAVITHVNGAPVTDGKTLLETIAPLVAQKRSLLVEFVANEQQKAIEYRLM